MKKILIMDDEPAFIKNVLFRLEKEGIQKESYIYCSQIEEFFSALTSMHKDIVCISMDLLIGDNMNVLKGDSKINGLNALSRIHTQYPAIPVVLFSILSADEGGIGESIEGGRAEFISKTDKDGLVRLVAFYKLHLNA